MCLGRRKCSLYLGAVLVKDSEIINEFISDNSSVMTLSVNSEKFCLKNVLKLWGPYHGCDSLSMAWAEPAANKVDYASL